VFSTFTICGILKLKYIYLSVFTLLIFSISGCTPFHKMPLSGLYWLQGEWKGVGLQLDYPQSWTLVLEVENAEFGVRYPTLNCSGELKMNYNNRHRAEFIEVIWQGRDNCTNNNKIVLTYIDKYHISYSCFSPDTGKLDASATLVNTAYKDILKI